MTYTFEVKTHKNEPRFTVIRIAREKIRLPRRGVKKVLIGIRTREGLPLLSKTAITLKSGNEVYGPKIRAAGVKKNQWLKVSVSRASQTQPYDFAR
ncbi:MAG TPA: hypothetical protein VMS37_10440 [Verrucomicrobiae bacterium]|nr:hypothetical protein [Verrucomicrobiae bacterium]